MRSIQLTIFLLLTVMTLSCCDGMFYYPDSHVYQTPRDHGLPYEDAWFQSSDGTRLHGWFVPATSEPLGTVVVFHGNAMNLTAHFSFVDWLPAEGFNVFIFDYRGYGKSQGRPTRKGVYEDSVAAIRYVQSRSDLAPDRLLVFGQSLGAATAVAALGNNDFKGIRAVAVYAPFYSYRELGRDKLAQMPIIGWFKWPLGWMLLSGGYNPGDVVDKVSPIPLAIMHGTADRIIPCDQGRKLFEKAKEPKELWIIEGGSHITGFSESGSIYRDKLVRFFKKALP